jgi:predicted regulator of Ras-like GTPase activity (Roadblock/LC7/MglB family)
VAKIDLVMFEEEFEQLQEIIARLQHDSSSKVVFLVDKNGQQIAASGDVRSIDATSLASLTAGNVAATDGLAKLIGEKEFSLLFHEGEKDNLHISIVGKRGILVVIFDQSSSLALVRLRVKKASRELQEIFERVEERAAAQQASTTSRFDSPFSEITDEDIDKLFGD